MQALVGLLVHELNRVEQLRSAASLSALVCCLKAVTMLLLFQELFNSVPAEGLLLDPA